MLRTHPRAAITAALVALASTPAAQGRLVTASLDGTISEGFADVFRSRAEWVDLAGRPAWFGIAFDTDEIRGGSQPAGWPFVEDYESSGYLPPGLRLGASAAAPGAIISSLGMGSPGGLFRADFGMRPPPQPYLVAATHTGDEIDFAFTWGGSGLGPLMQGQGRGRLLPGGAIDPATFAGEFAWYEAAGYFVATFPPAAVAAVPEPSTLAMGAVAALIGLGCAWRRRGRATA